MHTRLSAVVLLASAVSLAAEAPPTTLTLDQALSELDSRNLTLAQAKARAGEARGVSRQALAGLLPTLGVGGSYVRNNEGFSLDLQKPFGQLATVLSTALHTPFSFSDLPGKATIQPLEAFTGQATLRLPLFAANGYQDYLAASEAALAAEQSAEGARLQLGKKKIKTSAVSALGNGATAQAIKRAERLGYWYAMAGSTRSVFDMMGLTV